MDDNMKNLFREQIDTLNKTKWFISFDSTTSDVKIVNDKNEEMDDSTLGFLLGQIEDYGKIKHEQKYGERRKAPLDEFTKKRLEIEDYQLITDEQNRVHRKIFEVYHDQNSIFHMESFSVSKKNGLTYDEFSAYLTVDVAEKVIESLSSFIKKNRHHE